MPTGDLTDRQYNPNEQAGIPAASRFQIGYGTGTAYAVTATPAAIVQGTTSPTITLPFAGVWLLWGYAHLQAAAATWAATKNIVTLVQRTNNTPGAVAGATVTTIAPIITTTTQDLGMAWLPPTLYTTSNGNDALTLYTSVATAPSAGALNVVDCAIWAQRLY